MDKNESQRLMDQPSIINSYEMRNAPKACVHIALPLAETPLKRGDHARASNQKASFFGIPSREHMLMDLTYMDGLTVPLRAT